MGSETTCSALTGILNKRIPRIQKPTRRQIVLSMIEAALSDRRKRKGPKHMRYTLGLLKDMFTKGPVPAMVRGG